MRRQVLYTSLTRISDLPERAWEPMEVDRDHWRGGDYVLVEVRAESSIPVELSDGRMTTVFRGDRLVGALGRRAATLEVVGTFEEVAGDGAMELLTGAGLLGRATSVSPVLERLVGVAYRGHVAVAGETVSMRDHAAPALTMELTAPLVLIVGTSMSAGKTTAAAFAIRTLKAAGMRVVGAKLTGAGRYRDILAMRDAGADAIVDFVDAGLPSTVVPAEEYRPALAVTLSQIAAAEPDVVVVEAGASPREPYNGEALIDMLGECVRCRILAASDPYAVVGVQTAFGWDPHLVTGPATNTTAAIDLIERLSGLTALNLLRQEDRARLEVLLRRTLELET